MKDLKKGEIFNKENVRAIRPGLGLPTKYLDVVLGKKRVSEDVSQKGTALAWNLIE